MKGSARENLFLEKVSPRTIQSPILLTRILVTEDEGLAVGTLDHSRVRLVRANTDSLESTVVALAGVVCTLGNGALDHAVLIVLIHFCHSFRYNEFLKSKIPFILFTVHQHPIHISRNLFLREYCGGISPLHSLPYSEALPWCE